MAALDASAVAALLLELGRRTALAGDNYFRAKAYQRAADRLAALVEPLELGITDLAALEAAAREDRLKRVKGLGAAVQRKILDGLKIREHALGARHLHRAEELAVSTAETLQHSLPGLIRTVTAGDLRRGGELVSNLALVAEVEQVPGPPKLGLFRRNVGLPHRSAPVRDQPAVCHRLGAPPLRSWNAAPPR